MGSEGTLRHQGTDESGQPLPPPGLKGQGEKWQVPEPSKSCNVGEEAFHGSLLISRGTGPPYPSKEGSQKH